MCKASKQEKGSVDISRLINEIREIKETGNFQ